MGLLEDRVEVVDGDALKETGADNKMCQERRMLHAISGDDFLSKHPRLWSTRADHLYLSPSCTSILCSSG